MGFAGLGFRSRNQKDAKVDQGDWKSNQTQWWGHKGWGSNANVAGDWGEEKKSMPSTGKGIGREGLEGYRVRLNGRG